MSASQERPLRILAVDDQESILDLYQEFLTPGAGLRLPEKPGARAETAASGGLDAYGPAGAFELTLCYQGEEAVEAVRSAIAEERPFAVAFIDVRLPPGPDGVWVAEQIRALDPNIQIVIVTAYSDVGARELSRRIPPADKLLYLQQPFYPEEIKQFATALGAKWQREIELLKIHTELETRVEQRTGELMQVNEQLKREIEERRRAEEALRESEKKLRLLSSHLLAAQERERRRISMELHDELGQALTFLKLQLRSIERNLAEEQPALRKDCERTLAYVDEVVENVRRLSRDLSPAILKDLGLAAALRWLLEDFARHYAIDTSIEMEDIDGLLSQDVQINIFRIFQEALTNVARHARASHVRIAIRKDQQGLGFVLSDNGGGFDVRAVMGRHSSESGLGLAAMKERARMLGGSLDIWSRPGEETKITLSVPMGKASRGMEQGLS